MTTEHVQAEELKEEGRFPFLFDSEIPDGIEWLAFSYENKVVTSVGRGLEMIFYTICLVVIGGLLWTIDDDLTTSGILFAVGVFLFYRFFKVGTKLRKQLTASENQRNNKARYGFFLDEEQLLFHSGDNTVSILPFSEISEVFYYRKNTGPNSKGENVYYPFLKFSTSSDESFLDIDIIDSPWKGSDVQVFIDKLRDRNIPVRIGS